MIFFFYLVENCHWDFDEDCVINLYTALGNMAFLTILLPPMHENLNFIFNHLIYYFCFVLRLDRDLA